MAIVTISRGSYSRGKAVAKLLAERLGYDCLSRDILLDASEHFHVPEMKLIRALHDAPSILDRFTYGKERYLAYIKKALLERVQHDNVVYHGLAGHLLLRGISHVMKVRIVANLDTRVRQEMIREGISGDEARRILVKDDDERRKWTQFVYGVDAWDARLYDIVLSIDGLGVDDAAALLEQGVALPCFQTTEESKRIFADKLLAARAYAKIVSMCPSATVRGKDGTAYVTISGPSGLQRHMEREITDALGDVPGLQEVQITSEPVATPD